MRQGIIPSDGVGWGVRPIFRISLCIKTRKETTELGVRDYIIKEVKGEFYPCITGYF